MSSGCIDDENTDNIVMRTDTHGVGEGQQQDDSNVSGSSSGIDSTPKTRARKVTELPELSPPLPGKSMGISKASIGTDATDVAGTSSLSSSSLFNNNNNNIDNNSPGSNSDNIANDNPRRAVKSTSLLSGVVAVTESDHAIITSTATAAAAAKDGGTTGVGAHVAASSISSTPGAVKSIDGGDGGAGVGVGNSLHLRKLPTSDILLKSVGGFGSSLQESTTSSDIDDDIFQLRQPQAILDAQNKKTKYRARSRAKTKKKNNNDRCGSGNVILGSTIPEQVPSSNSLENIGGMPTGGDDTDVARIVRISTNHSSTGDDITTTEHYDVDGISSTVNGSSGKGDGNGVSNNQNFYSLSSLMGLLCLNPKYRLKTQLMISFGTVNLLTILIIIAACIGVTTYLGETIKDINQNAFQYKLVPEIQSRSVRYLAESLEQQLMPKNMISIIVEATMDRFQGYPDTLFLHDYDEQQQVPFKDVISNNFIYPINHSGSAGGDFISNNSNETSSAASSRNSMLLNWQIPSNVINETNYQAAFYVRRFLIHPVFVLILIPAFYYHRLKK